MHFVSYLLRQPKSIAAISSVSEVSEAKIRAQYQTLYNQRNDLVDLAWIGSGGSLDNLPKIYATAADSDDSDD